MPCRISRISEYSIFDVAVERRWRVRERPPFEGVGDLCNLWGLVRVLSLDQSISLESPMSETPSPDNASAGSHDDASFQAEIHAALQWRAATGWPGKAEDMALAARLYSRYRGPTEPEAVCRAWHHDLASVLFDQLAQTSPPEELGSRHILCMLLMRAATLELGL